jgi:hypothetical protein
MKEIFSFWAKLLHYWPNNSINGKITLFPSENTFFLATFFTYGKTY